MVLLSTMLSISTPGDNYFCDLFAALSILRVLDIQNLQLHMACSLISHINVSIEVCFIWHRWFVHCVGFLTMSSLSWRPKKLAFCAGFYSKSLHLPLCSVTGMIYLLRSQFKDKRTIYEQLGAWSFADTFRTAEKRNLSRFQAMIHWMLHFWDTSDALESPKSSLVFFQSVRFFTTLCNEDLQNT